MRIARFSLLPRFLLLSVAAFAAGCASQSSTTAATKQDDGLAKAIAGTHRTAAFVARDAARKPQAVLEFSGIKPTMTVVEINPGGGYWTEILAPYMKGQGNYYATVSTNAAAVERWRAKLDANKEVYGEVKSAEFGRGVADIVPAGSADMVLTFRNVHNWMAAGMVDEAFAAFAKALKPGGILLIEEHRASTATPQDPKAANGYVREDYTIALAEKAGLKFVGKSEVLANPKDTKDYAGGVWTLPPTLRLGDKDREKYVAIGEADNYLLKFEKPKK
jgi:predicted methyltransferase